MFLGSCFTHETKSWYSRPIDDAKYTETSRRDQMSSRSDCDLKDNGCWMCFYPPLVFFHSASEEQPVIVPASFLVRAVLNLALCNCWSGQNRAEWVICACGGLTVDPSEHIWVLESWWGGGFAAGRGRALTQLVFPLSLPCLMGGGALSYTSVDSYEHPPTMGSAIIIFIFVWNTLAPKLGNTSQLLSAVEKLGVLHKLTFFT